MFNARTRLPRRRPLTRLTLTYLGDPSLIFGSYFTSRTMTKSAPELVQCATNAPNSIHILVQPHACGSTCKKHTSLRDTLCSNKLSCIVASFILQPAKICAPSKFKSGIWEYFYLKRDEEHRTFRAVCIVCSKSLAYSRGGTSTMWRHVQSIHSIEKP